MDTKKHICDSCGGVLKIDIDRQIYTCPFCGVTYDYAYFKEDDVLEKGDRFLRNGEFHAALDAYRFCLEKDPHNGYALEKIMLLTYGIPEVSKLNYKEIIDGFRGDPKDTLWVLDQADDDSRERLKTIHELIETMQKAAAKKKEIDAIEEDIATVDKRIDRANIKRYEFYIIQRNEEYDFEREYHPREYWKGALRTFGIAFLVCFVPGLLFIMHAGENLPFYIGFLIYIALFVVPLILYYRFSIAPRLRGIADCEKEMARYQAQKDEILKHKQDLCNEYNDYCRHINMTVRSMKKEQKDADKEI